MASAIERLAGKGTKLSDVETRKQTFKIQEEFDFVDFSDGEWHQLRLLPAPGVFVHGKHWIDLTYTPKDGKEKTVTIPKPCHNLDIRTGQFDTTKRDPIFENREHFTSRGEEGSTGFGAHYYMCVIDRSVQEKEPRKTPKPTKAEKEGFKQKGSPSWTPVRVLRLPKGAIEKIIKLAARNIKKGKKGKKEAFDLSDMENGRDIVIMFDNDAAPANKWDVQLADDPMAPLTKKEREYLIYDLEGAIKKDLEQESLEQTEKWVKEYIKAAGEGDDDEDEDEDDDDKPKKGKNKSKSKKGKSKRRDDDDDDDLDLDLDLDDDEDEDDDKPKKKKGKSKDKSSKKDKAKSKGKKKKSKK